MRMAWFDPFSGASGDMVLGALVDAGLDVAALREGLAGLDLDGYTLTAERTADRVIAGTRVRVTVDGARQGGRRWSDIRRLLEDSRLPDHVRAAALAVFAALAEVEAGIHGEPVDRVHFHEVGGVDAIVDIVGVCLGLDLLGVEAVFSGPPRLGQGMVMSRHGPLPVPAPATLALMARAGAPTAAPREAMTRVDAELLTPTGAALLTTLATFTTPAMVPAAIGYGYGTKELPWPNALRVVIGEIVADGLTADAEWLLETNLDDLSPQGYELLLERVFAAGAADAWLTPVQMKKGRPGTVVSAIADDAHADAVEAAIFANSPTLGVRRTAIRRTKADRRHVVAETPWGPVRVKLRGVGGVVTGATPEYEDVAAVARRHGLSFAEVSAVAALEGDGWLGRPWDEG